MLSQPLVQLKPSLANEGLFFGKFFGNLSKIIFLQDYLVCIILYVVVSTWYLCRPYQHAFCCQYGWVSHMKLFIFSPGFRLWGKNCLFGGVGSRGATLVLPILVGVLRSSVGLFGLDWVVQCLVRLPTWVEQLSRLDRYGFFNGRQ